jgi:TctA family transporter
MKKNNYLTIGLALIFLMIALMVLVDLLGMLSSYNFLGQYWPVILIFIGLFAFSGSSSKNNGFSFGLIILGILMLLNRMGAFQTQAGKTLLVILLGLSGLAILLFAVSKTPAEPKSKDR